MSELEKLSKQVSKCKNCDLCKTRINMVFGKGDPQADIMIIGEAPGKEEDINGNPFIGKSGKLLHYLVENIFLRNSIKAYFSNMVHCRPTINGEGNKDRKPLKKEIKECQWILEKQIQIINPKVIVALGNTPAQFLTKERKGINRLREDSYDYNGITVIPTFHPSYVLRSGGLGSLVAFEVYQDLLTAHRMVREMEMINEKNNMD